MLESLDDYRQLECHVELQSSVGVSVLEWTALVSAAQQNARPQFRGRANPRYHLSCPLLPWATPCQEPESDFLPVNRAIGRTRALLHGILSARVPAQGRYLPGSAASGSHHPGLAVRGLAEAWSPSLPLLRIVPIRPPLKQISETGTARSAFL
jgi:hypothetical protein